MANDQKIKSSEITPESVYLNRRTFIRAAALAGTTLATAGVYRFFNPPPPKEVATAEIRTVSRQDFSGGDAFQAQHVLRVPADGMPRRERARQLAYAPQLPFTAVDYLLINAFYARRDTRTPVLVGVATTGLFLVAALLVAVPFAWLLVEITTDDESSIPALVSGFTL